MYSHENFNKALKLYDRTLKFILIEPRLMEIYNLGCSMDLNEARLNLPILKHMPEVSFSLEIIMLL